MVLSTMNRLGVGGMKDDAKLKGTFVLVLVLGALMVLSWAGIFSIYLNRQ